MKFFTTLLLLITLSASADNLVVPVIEVYDADTIKTRLTLPNPLDVISVRIYGIDAPEKPAASYRVTGKLGRAACIKEAELALEATDYVKNLIKNHGNMLSLKSFEWDKYGGRVLADAYVIDLSTGVEINIADRLISKGYVVEYFGGKKTKDWCI